MTGLSPGARLGAYEILSPLGAGGMGEVYKARDTRLGRTVAIKILAPHLSAEPDRRARFEREAKTISTLSHPHICALYDVGEQDGTDYLVMEYLEGETLARRLEKGPLWPGEALAIAVQIGDGLAEAHGHGIVHRDLKPANVIINQAGHAKILDFGLARRFSQPDGGERSVSQTATFPQDLSREGFIVGTVTYLSPEQARGEEVDSRSDVFSFGVTLYEMLAGKPPFRGESATSTIAKIIESEPEPITAVRPDLPAGFSRVLRRCLQKRPEARYNDTRDLVAELRDVQHELRSGETSGDARPRQATEKLPWRWALATAAAAGLAVVVGLRLRERAPAPPALPTHRQITFTGKSFDAAISPDGKFVAYVTGDANDRRLMVQDLAAGASIEVLRAKYSRLPRWSPDGSEILVGVRLETGNAIVAVPRLGGPHRRYAPVGFDVVWSPDGSAFATALITGVFGIVQKDTGALKKIEAAGPYRWLFLMDWSRAGLLFVAVDDKERHSLWRMTPDGTDRGKLHEEEGSIAAARWSASSDAVYFMRTQQQTAELCKLRLSPSRDQPLGPPACLLSGLHGSGSFTVSGDGRRLAYTRSPRHTNLWLATLEQPLRTESVLKPRQLTSGTFVDESPQISPDGTLIAFSRGDGQSSNIFLMPVEGGSPVQLTFFKSRNGSPAWSLDGKEIAFGSMEGGSPRVWRVSAVGGQARPFARTRLSGDALFITWWPGKHILYQRPGNRNFHVLDPATEEERPLVKDESVGWILAARFALDGQRVALRWNRGKDRGLWIVPLEGAAPIRVGNDNWDPVAWSADGRWIYAFDQAVDRSDGRIIMIRSDGTGTRAVGQLAPDHREVQWVDVHGSRMALSIAQTQSDVWLVDRFDPDVR